MENLNSNAQNLRSAVKLEKTEAAMLDVLAAFDPSAACEVLQDTPKRSRVEVALADGYVADPVCVASPAGGIGIHYVNPFLVDDSVRYNTAGCFAIRTHQKWQVASCCGRVFCSSDSQWYAMVWTRTAAGRSI
jgi:hypothetical protein